MSNMHRVKWIDQRIREKSYPNCRTIAEKFEISSRQASRDIEYLRYSLGAPVEYAVDKNGYYYTDSAFELPSVFISDEEKQTLSYLAYKYAEAGNDQALKLAGLFSRLTGDTLLSKASPGDIPVYGMQGREAAVFNRIRKAITDLEKVEIEYISARNELTRRIVCPYKLFSSGQTTYAVGYCELRKENRVFKLPRIRSIAGIGVRFEIPPTFRPELYTDENFHARKNPYVARVSFTHPPVAGTYKIDILTINDSVYEMAFLESGELISMLLSQRAGFVILSPNWLREKLLKKIDEIAANNSQKITSDT